ncbi:response regulator transcription factor [Paenibacillus hunanensis]|uniref:DNA-binding response OmpR family regulator n=1 Tax=Paenibacillus hunanensis TaxID=539262 RepID=A0ABU1J3U9_9BACL|nr:response regulator transcription factor [Paenibacillus hunanensis]MDR6245247.1 DNA-binding response OmpR family regulator [Paenibacillus hunanensis]WPP40841.1 response regulator transcription factor [Paenibacillus hunanensis]GGJ27005.1 DNA-binding response regulator [Paenibacillus hunanensis]
MKNILIIEDDEAIAAIERDYLEINNFAVQIADNGITGAELALSGRFDLILLDLMLPGEDGFSVCRRLREKLDIPILMVTAKQEDIDKIRGLGLGADDYIVKPFSPNELVARVKSNLAQYARLKGNLEQSARGGNIEIGPFLINIDAHRAYLNGQELELKKKEFELLHFLVINSNIVFSKDALYERIWGLDSIGDSATVAVHINRLRDKIEADPGNPRYIQTVWGAGYRFQL